MGPRGVFSLEKESGGVEGATHTCPLVVWYSALYLQGSSVFLFLLVSFYAYGSKKKGAGSVDIPYFDSHLHCCGECPGRRGGGVNEKVSECTEKENW